MNIPTLDSFPHNQIIAKSKINVSDLDEDIKTMIADFIKRYTGYKLKWNEASAKTLMATSNVISQNIYDYYVDKDDQDVDITPATDLTPTDIKDVIKDIKDANAEPAPAPAKPAEPATPAAAPATPAATPATPAAEPAVEIPKNKNEKILHDLFTAGTLEGVSKKQLSALGFDTDLISVRGGRVGAYQLKKEFSELTYKLSKV